VAGRAGQAGGGETARRSGEDSFHLRRKGCLAMNENTRPRIVGHRGAMAHRPENTLESYRYAEELGVAEIELDIRLSADGHVFILHDATIDRVAPVPGSPAGVDVSTLTLEQLRG